MSSSTIWQHNHNASVTQISSTISVTLASCSTVVIGFLLMVLRVDLPDDKVKAFLDQTVTVASVNNKGSTLWSYPKGGRRIGRGRQRGLQYAHTNTR